MFQTTCWLDIHDAQMSSEAQQRIAIETLLKTYWKPVYCYLRRKGYANETAKDLTQDFFHKVVLERKLIQLADQNKGRFRTFLLTALDHCVANIYHKNKANKRSPKGRLVRFGELDGQNEPEIPEGITPDEAFHYTWASDLLDEVLAEVQGYFCSSGKEVYWQVFEEKVLDAIFGSSVSLPMSEICLKHDIESESTASNMIVTVKRRFKAVLKSQLRRFVSSEAEVIDEFNELLNILSKGGAR